MREKDCPIEQKYGPRIQQGVRGEKFDGGKPLAGLLYADCTVALGQIVDVLTFGANKYEPKGWREVPEANRRYTDALHRHLAAHYSGDVCDDESGLTHLAHAATNIIFLLELEKEKD